MNLIEQEIINKIKHHYEIANELIKLNQINKAKQELFNKMSKELYDISLDLIDNRNLVNKNSDLRKLVIDVHNKFEPQDKQDDLLEDNLLGI
jgi:hypothetical protein